MNTLRLSHKQHGMHWQPIAKCMPLCVRQSRSVYTPSINPAKGNEFDGEGIIT